MDRGARVTGLPKEAVMDGTEAANEAMRRVYNRVIGRQPNYRYFDHRGWMYCWTTERMSDGKYAAFVYKPIGQGSQSGKARRWEKVKELRFRKRNTAKARALTWLRAAQKRTTDRELSEAGQGTIR